MDNIQCELNPLHRVQIVIAAEISEERRGKWNISGNSNTWEGVALIIRPLSAVVIVGVVAT